MSPNNGIDPFFEQTMREDNSFGKEGKDEDQKAYEHFKTIHETQMQMVIKNDYQGLLAVIESDECLISINHLSNIPALKKFISEHGTLKANKLLQLADHEKGARDRFSSGRFRGLQVKKPWVNPLVLQGLFCTVGLTASILKNKFSK